MEELENAELEQDGDEDYYLVVPECEPFYFSAQAQAQLAACKEEGARIELAKALFLAEEGYWNA